MSRALVVGAGSPLGEATSAAFAAAGHDVVGTSRSGSDRHRVVDVTDHRAVQTLLREVRPSVAVYLVRPDLPPRPANSDAAIGLALGALRNFANAARGEGVERLLFASSSAVYGTDIVEPRAEDDLTPAPGAYAQLKLKSEQLLAEFAATDGLVTTALRIFNVYGPGFRNSLVNRLVDAAAGAKPPTVFPTNRFVRDYVHVSDVAETFVAAAVHPVPLSRVVNVGTGVGTGNLDLTGLIPSAPWMRGAALERPSVCIAETSRLRTVLGTVPPLRLLETFSRR